VFVITIRAALISILRLVLSLLEVDRPESNFDQKEEIVRLRVRRFRRILTEANPGRRTAIDLLASAADSTILIVSVSNAGGRVFNSERFLCFYNACTR